MDRPVEVRFRHVVRFTSDVFGRENTTLEEALGIGSAEEPTRVLIFVDAGVADAWPGLDAEISDWVERQAGAVELAGEVAVLPGGEACKNSPEPAERVLSMIHAGGLCRHSYVIAIGGGAMLDAVGYAAALAHRGVRLVRLPTTTLAQDDAGIGVKNGINAFGSKNFLGTFAVPVAVINDERYLTTLSDRDYRAGWSEAVKVALLKDPAFFDRIEQLAPRLADRDAPAARVVVERCAELHLDHIISCGDPFEMQNARPLDFGHWSAHRLEGLTGYEVRHGEAVAIGIALDVVYSALVGMLDWATADRILGCMRGLGFTLYHDALEDTASLLVGLDEFREHLGGRLTITLLRDIGDPVDVHEVDTARVIEAVDHLASLGRDRATKCAG